MKKTAPFWRRPPLWSPKFGYYHSVLICAYMYYELKSKIEHRATLVWRELTLSKEQKRLQVLAGVRKPKKGKS